MPGPRFMIQTLPEFPGHGGKLQIFILNSIFKSDPKCIYQNPPLKNLFLLESLANTLDTLCTTYSLELKAILQETEVAAPVENQVIQHRDPHNLTGRLKPFCRFYIRVRRCERPNGVIMRKNDC